MCVLSTALVCDMLVVRMYQYMCMYVCICVYVYVYIVTIIVCMYDIVVYVISTSLLCIDCIDCINVLICIKYIDVSMMLCISYVLICISYVSMMLCIECI